MKPILIYSMYENNTHSYHIHVQLLVTRATKLKYKTDTPLNCAPYRVIYNIPVIIEEFVLTIKTLQGLVELSQ